MPEVLLRTAGASGWAALRTAKTLSATRCAELAAMPKELRATTTEAPAEAAMLGPAWSVLLMMLATCLRRRIHRTGAALRLRALAVVLATLRAVHGRAAEVSTALIVILAALVAPVFAARSIGGAAPTLILGRVHGGTRSWALGTLWSAARGLRTRGATLARAFGAWRIAPLRCGGRGRALRSRLGWCRGLVGRLGILG